MEACQNILITLAVNAEFAPWRQLQSFRQIQLGGLSLHETTIGHARVRVILTGIGARGICDLDQWVLQYRPDAAVVGGVAAGLNPNLRTGDILVAKSVSGQNENASIRSDPGLLHEAVQCGATRIGRLLTVAHVIRTAEAKCVLAGAGEAAEMETLMVMQRLSRAMVPAVAIRAIADTAHENVPYDFEAALDAGGQIRVARLAPQVMIRPWTLARAIQFGLMCRRATMSLAGYLDHFVQRLAAHTPPHSLLAVPTS
jgi:nucleoside phosphorylase